jgi:hypothetical protein
MYKFIYLPEPEIPVYHISRSVYSKEILNRYIITKNYYFYRSSDGNCIHSGLYTSNKVEKIGGDVIRKHLLEIMEFPDV